VNNLIQQHLQIMRLIPKRLLKFILPLLGPVLFTHSQNLTSNEFLFPIKTSPLVSGSFAELRANHFHSGIDISTNGKTGIPVVSMKEGIVYRIKISPVGYGNAIYVKHPNGYTTVYGHLSGLSNKLDSIITKEQYKIQSFAIDYFPKTNIFIKKGEIIGFSGNSGSSGGPHLHYEIRDSKTEEPLNPFFFQSLIKDNVRPQIQSIRIYPLTPSSLVNRENKPQNFPVVFYDGQFHLKGNPKISAEGHVGISIQMLDYMSGSWKKCGVYKLEMFVDNQSHYGWEMNRFSFHESRYLNSHIDYSYKQKYGKRYQRCFLLPNNQLSIYHINKNNGHIVINKSKNIQLVAEDAKGNRSVLKFTIIKNQNIVKLNQAPPLQNSTKLSFNQAHNIAVNSISCHIPKGSFYDNTDFEIKQSSSANGRIIYQVGNRFIPLHKYISLSFALTEKETKYGAQLCLATLTNKNSLSYAGGTINNDSILLRTRSLGKYTFAIDSINPKILPVNVNSRTVFTNKSILKFKITDNFSGVKTYNGYINKQWVLFRYDAKTHALNCPVSKIPVDINGSCQLELIITDNCGNSSVFKEQIILNR
jgi:hypothetical protein